MRVELNRREAKGRAAALKDRLTRAGIAANTALCYELLATAFDENSWNVLSAKIEARERELDPWPGRAKRLAELRRKARIAGLSAEEVSEIVRTVEGNEGVLVEGDRADRDLDLRKDEIALLVPLCSDYWEFGRFLLYVADGTGRLEGKKGHVGHKGNRKELGILHPRSWFLRQCMRMRAVAPHDGRPNRSLTPVREELADVLLDQASSSIRAFASRLAPGWASFAERTRCWLPDVARVADTRPDPDGFVNRTRRFHWAVAMVADLALDAKSRRFSRSNDDHLRMTAHNPEYAPRFAKVMDAFERDPEKTVRRAMVSARKARGCHWYLEREDLDLLLSSPWRAPVPDIAFREAACETQAMHETLCWHILDLRNPGLLPDDERGVIGGMSHLMFFRGLRRRLDKSDLAGLRESVDAVEWACVYEYLQQFRSLTPEDAYSQWGLYEAAKYVFRRIAGNVRDARKAAGEEKPRPLYRTGEAADVKIGVQAALFMAEERPVPEVIAFLGMAYQAVGPNGPVEYDRRDALLRELPLYAEAERAVVKADLEVPVDTW